MASPFKTNNQDQLNQSKLQYLFDEAFTRSIDAMDKRNDNLTKAISHLESTYLSAGSDISKQYSVKQEAKIFLAAALAGVVNDIEAVASSVNQCVNLEINAVESLAVELKSLEQRINITKESNLKQRYSQLTSDIPEEFNVASRIIPREKSTDLKVSVDSNL